MLIQLQAQGLCSDCEACVQGIRNILGNLKREMSQAWCGHSFVILRDVTTSWQHDGVSGVFTDSDTDDPGCDRGQCGDILSSTGPKVPKN